MSTDYGVIRTDDGLPRVSFERVLDAAIDRVWALLTTEEGLERWLAPASVELSIGGTMDIDFGDGGVVGGEIIDLEDGRSLVYHWRFTGEPDSVIRFELEEVAPAVTRLRLDHRLLPPEQAVGYGAGWHAHIDQLESIVTGDGKIDWSNRFNELLPEYQDLI